MPIWRMASAQSVAKSPIGATSVADSTTVFSPL